MKYVFSASGIYLFCRVNIQFFTFMTNLTRRKIAYMMQMHCSFNLLRLLSALIFLLWCMTLCLVMLSISVLPGIYICSAAYAAQHKQNQANSLPDERFKKRPKLFGCLRSPCCVLWRTFCTALCFSSLSLSFLQLCISRQATYMI